MKKFLIGVLGGVCLFQLALNTSLVLKFTDVEMKKSHQDVLAASSSATLVEKFIPLGTGNTNSNQWTNVPGLQVSINPSMYKNLQQVYFEVGLVNPNNSGSTLVQLYNVTKGVPVYSSIVTINNGNSGYVASGPITLSPGVNVYQVQMQNTLNAPAILTQARLRMISK